MIKTINIIVGRIKLQSIGTECHKKQNKPKAPQLIQKVANPHYYNIIKFFKLKVDY